VAVEPSSPHSIPLKIQKLGGDCLAGVDNATKVIAAYDTANLQFLSKFFTPEHWFD
jgi:hypothetical protein